MNNSPEIDPSATEKRGTMLPRSILRHLQTYGLMTLALVGGCGKTSPNVARESPVTATAQAPEQTVPSARVISGPAGLPSIPSPHENLGEDVMDVPAKKDTWQPHE